MVEEELNKAIANFNQKAEADPKLRCELEGKVRHVFIEVTDGQSYCFTLKDCRISPLEKGRPPETDIHIATDCGTLEALLKREMGPMKALVTKRLKLVKISMEDLNTLRKFF